MGIDTTPERGDAGSVRLSRRDLLKRSALGLGLLPTMSWRSLAALAQGPTHHTPTAKRMIVLFMSGGMSQLDLFDPKPLLNERRGEDLPPSIRNGTKSSQLTERQGALAVVGSRFEFKRYGTSGLEMSELLPHIGGMADKLTLIRSLQTDHVLHEAAVTELFTGTALLGRPSWGSWVSHALGSANPNLPEFVVMLSSGDRLAPLHPRLWHNGFLPGKHQGVFFRSKGAPVLYLDNPPGVDATVRKKTLETIEALNGHEAERTAAAARIETRNKTYEMAARMQTSLPELAALKEEPPEVLKRYGAEIGKPSFANNCLLARRLVERGVRFVQLMDGAWDHHYNIPRVLPKKCGQVDRPIGALLGDLDERGLLDDTIVVMVGEFGRTPFCEGPLSFESYGRDHNGQAAGAIVAGGGFRQGFSYGKTDEWGWAAIDEKVHVHDLQATILHCLGFNHEKLTYRNRGRDFRLTDVGGRVIAPLLA